MNKIILIMIVVAFPLFAYWEKVEGIPDEYKDNVYLDVFFLPDNPDLGWVCGFQSAVLRTTDGGETWQGARVPVNGMQLESIMFLNDTLGYASGPNSSTTENEGNVFKSTDGGETWFDISPDDNNFTLWGFVFYR
jgi:photosystem II stability/assembly factor-like uncharacterized protein